MKRKTNLFNNMFTAILFIMTLIVGACADNDLDNNEVDKSAIVKFDVKDVQELVLANAKTKTRAGYSITSNDQLSELGLTQNDLKPQILKAQAPEGMEACLVETTIPGINPTQPNQQTRAFIVTDQYMGNFSTLGYRAVSKTSVSQTPDWFYNERTKSNGELYNTLYWSWSNNRFGRFYAVFPEVDIWNTKMKLSPATYVGTPYVEFEVEPDVFNQKDLMTACSGIVEYKTRGVAPNSSLAFRHALTAIHFTVGQNLWVGQIDKIEISGAINKGTYTLSNEPDQPGTWTLGNTTGTFTLKDIILTTDAKPGSVITDARGNYTFFMIPQDVTNKNIYVDIHFMDGKIIHVPLKGKWLPGTTKTYTLSNLNSNWQYQLEVLGQNNTVDYDKTDAGYYAVRSFRQSPTGNQLPIAWKVVGYQESVDGGVNFGPETQTKPDWLDNLSMTEGTGGREAQVGTATVKKATLVNKLAAYNKVLHDATAKGSAGNYYDLSMHDFKGTATAKRNTANSYLISAPGYYRIPLVYGNAIKEGADNTSAYVSSAPATMVSVNYQSSPVDVIMHRFKDHNGADIHSPYINVQNASDPATQASIVWTDKSGIVDGLSVTNNGADSYLNFHVPADKIKSGNAVIAVKNAAGTIMWSWHFWFAKDDVLETIPCTNFTNHVYKFTKQPLGFVWNSWQETSYEQPRVVRVKIEQTIGQNTGKKFAYLDITQKPGSIKQVSCTNYSFGRKDAVVAPPEVADGATTFNSNGNPRPVSFLMQHPEHFFDVNYSHLRSDVYNTTYYNLWSVNNTKTTPNDNRVEKTIYDPCPVGFTVPASNAFTGFSKTGENLSFFAHNMSDINAVGDWNSGWTFYNKINNPDAIIEFPNTGYASSTRTGNYTYYWEATPINEKDAYLLAIELYSMGPTSQSNRAARGSIRPAAEK